MPNETLNNRLEVNEKKPVEKTAIISFNSFICIKRKRKKN